MPRYRYQCEKCEEIFIIFHMISEEIKKDCTACDTEESLNKLLSIPHIKKTGNIKKDQSVGSTTSQFIEDNREILDNQKKETRNKEYDKT